MQYSLCYIAYALAIYSIDSITSQYPYGVLYAPPLCFYRKYAIKVLFFIGLHGWGGMSKISLGGLSHWAGCQSRAAGKECFFSMGRVTIGEQSGCIQ